MVRQVQMTLIGWKDKPHFNSTIEMGMVPQDLGADSKTHKVYASAKFQDKIFVLGPRLTALNIPIVTLDTPTAVVGFMSSWSRCTSIRTLLRHKQKEHSNECKFPRWWRFNNEYSKSCAGCKSSQTSKEEEYNRILLQQTQ